MAHVALPLDVAWWVGTGTSVRIYRIRPDSGPYRGKAGEGSAGISLIEHVFAELKQFLEVLVPERAREAGFVGLAAPAVRGRRLRSGEALAW